MARAKRNRITVRWAKAEGLWEVQGPPSRVLVKTQREAVQIGVDAAKRWQPAQLVVFTRKGRIAWERTYPRSTDPRRSKG